MVEGGSAPRYNALTFCIPIDRKRYPFRIVPSIDKWFPFHINIPTILFKTFWTLCFPVEENVIQVDPPPPRTVLDVTSQTLFTYFAFAKDLNFVQGGMGEKSCKGHVYE